MIRAFMMALLTAMARLGSGLVQAAWWPVGWTLDRLSALVGGGGGGGSPAAPRSLADLPDATEAHEAKHQAKDQQRAADILLDHPARQVKMWINAAERDRETVPLTKLSMEQQIWLQSLPVNQLQLLLDAPDRKIFDALTGREDAIPGVLSYGGEPERAGPLTERIRMFRNGELGPAPHAMTH